MIEFSVSLPCSVNNLYTVWKNRKICSKIAKEYEKKTMLELMLIKPLLTPISGNVSIEYEFTFPDNRKRDASNYIKQLEDIIVKMGLIEDDSMVVVMVIRKQIKKGLSEAKVKIEPFSLT